MASPQPDRFTKLSNELLEALMTVKMSGSEWQFIMCLFRKTYGFNKKEDWITNSQICEAIGLPKERVSEAKKRLLARNIVTEKRNKISIQKDYERWVELRKSVTAVTEKRNKLLRKSVNTKEKKETIQKTLGETSSQVDLKDKEKDMGWNQKADDYEEGVVDLDGDGVIQEQQPKKVKKTTPEMKQVFELFNNPAKKAWHMYKSEREAAKILLETYGLETIKKRVERIELEKKRNAGDNFMPIINSPSTMLKKMEAMEKYLGI